MKGVGAEVTRPSYRVAGSASNRCRTAIVIHYGALPEGAEEYTLPMGFVSLILSVDLHLLSLGAKRSWTSFITPTPVGPSFPLLAVALAIITRRVLVSLGWA